MGFEGCVLGNAGFQADPCIGEEVVLRLGEDGFGVGQPIVRGDQGGFGIEFPHLRFRDGPLFFGKVGRVGNDQPESGVSVERCKPLPVDPRDTLLQPALGGVFLGEGKCLLAGIDPNALKVWPCLQ